MFGQESIEFSAAFLAGLLSFVSPCVLPLIPAYLSFISGVSVEELMAADKTAGKYGRLLANTFFFVIGFSIIFVLLGAGASSIGGWLQRNLSIFNKVAGVVVFLFGLHVAGVFKIKALNYEKRIHMTGQKKRGVIGSTLLGMAFGFGWTPCIGPILGSILIIAAQQQTLATGVWLLLIYSAGLGIPFILTALLFNYLIGTFSLIKRHFRVVEVASGVLLMLVGVLIFFDLLQRISNYLLDLFPVLQKIG
jgi:cytochrome c-type biogenesis protein